MTLMTKLSVERSLVRWTMPSAITHNKNGYLSMHQLKLIVRLVVKNQLIWDSQSAIMTLRLGNLLDL